MAGNAHNEAKEFFAQMSGYFTKLQDYARSTDSEQPLFLELLPTLEFAQLVTDSQRLAKGNPNMVSGALIESTSAMFATLREAGMRAKIRSDFFAEAEGSAAEDSKFYLEQGQVMSSFINGRNEMQS